jgi:Fur family ferric uptake transcriptional regulator
MTTTGDTDDARVDEILGRLKGNGGRLTTGRRAIVQALLAAGDHHLNADELAATVQAQHPHIHLSTVYRTLDALEVAGVLDRMALGTGGAVYHFTDHVHHHLVCKDCGAVVDIPPDLVSSLTGELQRRFGYDLDQARLAVSGRCERCRAALPTTPASH